MIEKDKIVEKNMKVVVPAIRFAGVLIFFFGLAVLFNLGGIGESIVGTRDGLHKIIGMVFAISGIVEVIVMPRIIETLVKKNKK